MAEDTTTTEETTTEETTEVDDTTEETTEETTEDKVDRAELDKVVLQRQKLKDELRKLKADLAAKDKPKDQEPSEADKLRAALARTAASSVLVGQGITEKADQDAVLALLRTDALDVDADGSVDTDTLTEHLDELRRIFTPKETQRRVVKVDTRKGQGDSGSGVDADTKRYRRIIGQ